MHPYFEVLTPRWFKRAFVYTGSIGEFRYRFANDKENNLIHAAVYTHFAMRRQGCAGKWIFRDDEGVEQLKAWLQEKLEENSSQCHVMHRKKYN